MKDFSYITNSHPAFIENLYQDFVKDPNSVDPELKKFFEGFDFAMSFSATDGNGNGNGTATAAKTVAQPDDTEIGQGKYECIGLYLVTATKGT